jgi:hypothetical protein
MKLFDCIETELRGHVSFIARVNSNRCPNVKLGFQNICKQLLHNNLNVSGIHFKGRVCINEC